MNQLPVSTGGTKRSPFPRILPYPVAELETVANASNCPKQASYVLKLIYLNVNVKFIPFKKPR